MIRSRQLWEDAVLEDAETESIERAANKGQMKTAKKPKKNAKAFQVAAFVRAGSSLDENQVSEATIHDRGMRFSRPISPVITEQEKARSQEVHEMRLRVVGTCQDLEKPYLRLTTVPNPATIRPPDVLKRALTHVLERFETDGDYPHALEQFKSIRQDLIVQGINDELAMDVYEQNARTSLTVGDYAEYSQCQLRLFTLYQIARERFQSMTKKQKARARKKGVTILSENEPEFRAYRLLYHCMFADSSALASVLNEELAVNTKQPIVQTALDLVHSVQAKDFLRFYVLLKQFPHGPARHMLKKIRRSMRDSAIRALFVAHRPTIPIVFLRKVLGFSKCRSCRAFLLKNYDIVFAQPQPVAEEHEPEAPKKKKRKKEKKVKKVKVKQDLVDVVQSLPRIAATQPPRVTFKVF